MPSRRASPRTETPQPLRLARADRRQDLLDAAAELIVAEGVEGLAMDSVAERAGVSRPLVYKHFTNRDNLLTALYGREAIAAYEDIAADVRVATSLADRYRQLVHAALRASRERGALLAALRSAGALNRELRHEQQERDRQTVRFFARLACDELGIPPADAEAVTGMLLTALESVLGQWRHRRTAANARLLEETYMDMVVATLERVARRSETTQGEVV